MLPARLGESMRAQLIPVDGTPPLEIRKDLTLVGRKEDSDLCLAHKSVSKLHCIIVKTDGLLLLRDLGSTNGTRVNGLRVRRAALLPNDQLAIAGFKFRVHLGAEGAAPAEPEDGSTQRMDADEVAKLLQKHGIPPAGSANPPAIPPNPLPDLYTDRKER
jgi:pSer/pThr/pTyr-binding forkhead associated (FHA) protein